MQARRRILPVLVAVAAVLPRVDAAEPVRLRQSIVEGIEFIADHDLPRNRLNALAGHVADVQQRLAHDLALPPVESTLRIYLFDDRPTFSQFVQEMIPFVHWSQTMGRHGIFLQRDGQPYVFLLVSDELEQSLRHETVHVVLNAAIPDAPVWLDEGLAQCYESADGTHDSERATRILRRDWLLRDPPSLESLSQNESMEQMSPRDYAGAWHIVRQMLVTEQGRESLRAKLEQLRIERRSVMREETSQSAK